MKKTSTFIAMVLLLTSCTSTTDISSIDSTLESSSKSLGNVDMVNDITNQNAAANPDEKDTGNGDLKLSKDDQQVMAEAKDNPPKTTAKPKAVNSPRPTISSMDKDTTTLQVQEKAPGTGVEAVEGRQVSVHYVGKLTNGKEFDNSYKRGDPITFTLGAGQVIQGWDIGIEGMKVGGKRHLVIPPQLAYGDNSPSPDIPSGATLVFDVELVDVR